MESSKIGETFVEKSGGRALTRRMGEAEALLEHGTGDAAENGAAAGQTIITHSMTMVAPPPVLAAARRPHEAEPQDGADKVKRDEGYAERADDVGGMARLTAPVLAFPSFAEEVRRRACVQRQRRGRPARWLAARVISERRGPARSGPARELT